MIVIIESANKKKADEYFAIILAKHWWEWADFPLKSNMLMADDYVVVSYTKYMMGNAASYEAKTTIGICRKLEDAEMLFNHYRLKK